MFTKPRRFSACSAPAFVQRAVRPGRLGFFVESFGFSKLAENGKNFSEGKFQHVFSSILSSKSLTME